MRMHRAAETSLSMSRINEITITRASSLREKVYETPPEQAPQKIIFSFIESATDADVDELRSPSQIVHTCFKFIAAPAVYCHVFRETK